MQILLNQHAKHHDFQGVNLNFLKKFCVRNTCSILYVCLTLYVHWLLILFLKRKDENLRHWRKKKVQDILSLFCTILQRNSCNRIARIEKIKYTWQKHTNCSILAIRWLYLIDNHVRNMSFSSKCKSYLWSV